MRTLAVPIALIALLVSACAPAAQPTAAPAKPAPAASPGAKPPPEWEQAVAAAKREGKVVVQGPPGSQNQEALTVPFEKEFGITVDYLGAQGAEMVPKIASERQAGQYLWDVYVGGTTSGLGGLIPVKALDPLEPALILPDVKDPTLTRFGALDFVDEGRQLLVMTLYQRGTLFINTNLAKVDEFKSYRDLLDPKWKGKIVLDDPRKGGPGQATFTFFFLHKELGPDFIRALGRQELVSLRDFQQESDALGQGRYPILLGGNDFTITPLIQKGAPMAVVPPPQLREGSDLSAGAGAVAIFNRPPHPNAAKVYVNWLLGKEGQTGFARGSGYISARTDVPSDHTDQWRLPIQGAIKTYTKEALDSKDTLQPLLEEVLAR